MSADLYTEAFVRVLATYNGSAGDATKALYAELERLGALGQVAVNLFRAQKNSARAKVYRKRGYTAAAYERKQWAMNNLAEILEAKADICGIGWGWGEDATQPVHNKVLYVDLPTGQVSFHTDTRGDGPPYIGEWDGVRDASVDRLCRWIARLLSTVQAA